MIHTLKERNLNKIIKIDSDSDVFDILKNEDMIKIEKDRKNSAINYCKITKDLDHLESYTTIIPIKNSNEKIKLLTKEKEVIDKKIKIFKNKEKFEIKREKENQNILTNYFKEIATENFLNDFIEHKNNTQ